MEKKILDVTCGSRTIWFNKHHPNAVYCDKRKEEHHNSISKDCLVGALRWMFEHYDFEV